MLPASTLAAISNVVALNLEPRTTMTVLGAILAPLLPDAKQRAGRPRSKPRARAPAGARAPRKRKYRRQGPSEARERALAALSANPDATPTELAKLSKVSRATVVNARKDLAKQARKQARKAARETSTTAKPREPRERAQRFLKDTLAGGPKRASDVEEAAAKAHVDPKTLEQARADLGVLVSRSNTGVQAVTWSLPAP